MDQDSSEQATSETVLEGSQEIMDPLVAESDGIWLKQNYFEDAECRFQMIQSASLSTNEDEEDSSKESQDCLEEESSDCLGPPCSTDSVCNHPLLLESVRLNQPAYEEAESEYQMMLAGSLTEMAVDHRIVPNKPKQIIPNPGFDYGQKLDTLEKSLRDKHRTMAATYDKFQEVKDRSIANIRESIAMLRDTVDLYSWQVERDIEAYLEHEEQGRQFLDALASTNKSIREMRRLSHTKIHHANPDFMWKPLIGFAKNLNSELHAMSTAPLVPKVQMGDVTSGIRKAVRNMRSFELSPATKRFVGRYPRLIGDVCHAKVNISKDMAFFERFCESKTGVELEESMKNAVPVTSEDEESLDGSLGEECMGSEVVSNIKVLSNMRVVSFSEDHNRFMGGDGGGVSEGGDAHAVKKSKQRQVAISSSNASKGTLNQSLKKRATSPPRTAAKIKMPYPPKSKSSKTTKKADGNTGSAECDEDTISLDGSLGSDDSFSAQGDLIACFASLQKGEGKTKSTKKTKADQRKSKSNSDQSDKKTEDNNLKLAESNSDQSNKKIKANQKTSESDSHQSETKTTPPQSKTKHSESSSGGSSISPGLLGRGQTFPVSNLTSPLNHYQSIAQDLLRQQDVLLQRNRYEQRLIEMSRQLKQMLAVCGPSFEIQKMLSETELLRHMLFNNYIEDAFKHRLSLLQMAFNYNLRENPKLNQAAAIIFQSNLANTCTGTTTAPVIVAGKKKGKGKKKKQESKPLPPPPSVPSLVPAVGTPSAVAKVTRIGMMNPGGANDRHRPGISSMVVLDDLKRLVMVDIINGCIKLYAISKLHTTGTATLIQSVDLQQPYYMTGFGWNRVLVTRADQTISVFHISNDKGLELEKSMPCQAQYYGVGWITGVSVACANYDGNSIDLIRVATHHIEIVTSFKTHSQGPELLAVIPSTGNIAFLERVTGKTMHLTCLDPKSGDRLFSLALGGEMTDVWNVTCVEDKIVCCSKQASKIVLLSSSSASDCRLMSNTTLTMPAGTVKMPFAICFNEKLGDMFVANDAAWEDDRNHFVTTQVNVYSFASWSPDGERKY